MKKLADTLQELGDSLPESRKYLFPVIREAMVSFDPDMFVELLEDDLHAGGLRATVYATSSDFEFDLEFAGRDLRKVAQKVSKAMKSSSSCEGLRTTQSSDEYVITCEYDGVSMELILHDAGSRINGYLELNP